MIWYWIVTALACVLGYFCGMLQDDSEEERVLMALCFGIFWPIGVILFISAFVMWALIKMAVLWIRFMSFLAIRCVFWVAGR